MGKTAWWTCTVPTHFLFFVSPVKGGVDAKELFHLYILVWIQDKRLSLLETCKLDKVSSWLNIYILNTKISCYRETCWNAISVNYKERVRVYKQKRTCGRKRCYMYNKGNISEIILFSLPTNLAWEKYAQFILLLNSWLWLNKI